MTRRRFFQNAQWKVTRYGLECRTVPYDIAAKGLGNLRGFFPSLPLHMAEKNWVDIRLFCEAFREAVQFHSVVFDTARLDQCCARAVARSEYIARHSAACYRIAREQNIGTAVGTLRLYSAAELLRVSDLADAELAERV
jgi:hypothetical protein